MNKRFNLLGHDINIQPKEAEQDVMVDEQGNALKIGEKEISKATELLIKYKDGKTNLDNRIAENEKWYRLRHWETVGSEDVNKIEPASAWLFNSLLSKHSDAMDNYPEPTFLPRERGDDEEATQLTKIVPVVLDHNEYEQTYSDVWWYKIKHGGGAYGVFWDKSLENGLGDISIKKVEILNTFWEPGINKIQDSKNLFMVELIDNASLYEMYPSIPKGKLESSVITLTAYSHDDNVDISEKSLVIDWYYKVKVGTKTVLHYVKYVGNTVLFATENTPEYAERGIYDHGMYPIHIDVLFPIEGSPFGFGYIDIMREPQLYLDKLSSIIIKNAYQSGKKRYFSKNNGNINETEFADLSKDIVHVEGQVDEATIREIIIAPLPSYIIQYKQQIIDELKETSGNNDFSQGTTSGGVTSGAAIAALQEASNKSSRDNIKGAYRTFSAVNLMCVELIRQFYDMARQFRITGSDGKTDFVDYSNQNIKQQPLPMSYEGQDQEPGFEQSFRKPIFDIKVKAQKSNPFSRMAQNELAKEMYNSGFFDPVRADQALIALELMDFEGKQKIVEMISKNQQLLQHIEQMQQTSMQMAQVIEQMTGQPMTAMLGAQMQGQGQI